MKHFIRQTLTGMSEDKYKNFSQTLTPSVKADKVLGVRVPQLRKLAKEIAFNADISDFLNDLPHYYLEENHLHAYLIERYSDFETALRLTEQFLPFIDNWATCDTFCPIAFKKNPERLLPHADKWLNCPHVYTVRFAINVHMRFFLDDKFKRDFATRIAQIRSDEYYLNTSIAWYFATALAKQYDEIIPFIENQTLSVWVHNKTIQKAVESYRIPNDKKLYLKSLKIR